MLSIELVLVALSTVLGESLTEQIVITTIASFAATIGVYGVVALIVRLDDIGIWFAKKGYESIGLFLIKMMRFTIVALGYIGTVAMLLVAGTIFVHNIPFINEFFHNNLSFQYRNIHILEVRIPKLWGSINFFIIFNVFFCCLKHTFYTLILYLKLLNENFLFISLSMLKKSILS